MNFIVPPLKAKDLLSLLTPWGIAPHTIQALFEQIALAYSTEGRFYHTLAHVGQVLEVTEFIIHSGDYHLTSDTYLALKLAAWFHDVVYDPRRNDNEEQSAAWAAQAMEPLNLPASALTTTTHLILTTRNHITSPDALPAQFLLDADLAILGSQPGTYQQYAAAIRQEYAFVPDEAYRAGRVAVLERFLARPRIFFTNKAFSIWETSARENLRREITSLRQS
ncbi:MAG: hypothetical protein Fur0022_13930 [Anaerolineales bacterium]